ncbi:hypothetical protein [Coleofasciculus sp. E1-EBD-02]|uniref:hypothetical protein n=1 Tax=Coleofasciculus sp. E1-EBD-02 TaxID=3068481 RepID=UPI0032FEB47B
MARLQWHFSIGCNTDWGRVWGVGCGVWGVGCGVWGVGCGVWGVGCGVWGVGCGMWGVGCGVWGVGCGVWGVGWALPTSLKSNGTEISIRKSPKPLMYRRVGFDFAQPTNLKSVAFALSQ